jgi:hypothetical protein
MVMVGLAKEGGGVVNEFDDKAIDVVWDASCWPLRVIVRGDYEYTLVKHPMSFLATKIR